MILVTGSTDGIGRHTAKVLAAAGHRVVLHARDDRRAAAAQKAVPAAVDVVLGDLASLSQTYAMAQIAARHGPFGAVIHNAGVQLAKASRPPLTDDGLETTFQVNVLAPYVLTCLLSPPARLVYLTSGLQARGTVRLDDLRWQHRPWDGMQAYSDSKLYDVILAFAVARQWPRVLSNAVDPGWIKTRMGGPGATDDLPEGADTQVWLATSHDPEAGVTGAYFRRRRQQRAHPQAYDPAVQQEFLEACGDLSGVKLAG